MYERDVKYYNSLTDLQWVRGFLINPEDGAGSLNNAFDARNFRDVVMSVFGTGTVIVYGSIQKNRPDFSQPSTLNNCYFPITLADMSVPALFYAGATGVTVAAETKGVELDTNMISWFAVFRADTVAEVLLTVATAI